MMDRRELSAEGLESQLKPSETNIPVTRHDITSILDLRELWYVLEDVSAFGIW
jgi:hypothetical protein